MHMCLSVDAKVSITKQVDGLEIQIQRKVDIILCWERKVPLAAAKSFQSCPTLCDPIDGSPPGSAVPGILQARTLEWVAFPSPMHESEKWKWSHSVMSNTSRPHGLQPTRLLRPKFPLASNIQKLSFTGHAFRCSTNRWHNTLTGAL